MGFETALIGSLAAGIGTVGGAAAAVGTALAPIGTLFSMVTAASSLLGIGGDKPKVPTPTMPAAPAAPPRTTSGANVQLGTDDRISGSFRDTRNKQTSTDVLSGLGRGGLSI